MKLNTLQLRRAASALLLGLLMGVAMPKMNAQTAHVGDILCEGDLIVSPANYNASSHSAIGVVFYVDNTGQHGWAIALQDAGMFRWGAEGDTPLNNYVCDYIRPNQYARQAMYDLDGYRNTSVIYEQGEDYPAFFAVDFEHGWYLPTIGQLNCLYGNLNEVNISLVIVSGAQFIGEWEYWSSTECNSACAWWLKPSGILQGTASAYSNTYYSKDCIRRVRAAINF